MKKAAGSIRLDLAQYREMEIFTQFSSDLDEVTKKQLAYGEGLMTLLRQPQNNPFKLHEQIIILVSATARVMQDIPVDDILDFRSAMLKHFNENEITLCGDIESSGELTDDVKCRIIKVAQAFHDDYISKHAIDTI